ncbi:MAG: hypothetical protein AAF660_13780 [Pseudomonadota bacterium]
MDATGTQRLNMLAVVLTVATLVGCGGGVDSETVETQRLWVGVSFEALGGGSTIVNVDINDGGSSGMNVRLSGNERLEVDAAGFNVVLDEDQDFLDTDYEGRVPTDASNTQFTLSLFRADGSINRGTRATLPRRFDLISPVNDQAVTVGDRLLIQWTPSPEGGSIRLDSTAICSGFSRGEFRNIADSGFFSLDTGAIPGILDPQVPRNNPCRFSIRLTRERAGTLDPAFRGGGFVRALQEREAVLSLSF